ncbi:MAG TPA: ABC transporter permease, partial [Polyangiaceae bacterium]|nr:ABC transporter permease [Polyangiaceae bacterium]
QSAVKASDIVSGVIKGTVFCAAIALISCQQGLATSGGAEGVGRRTTSLPRALGSCFSPELCSAR